MKNDQYLRLEISLLNESPVEELIDRMGMEGWGIYLALLIKSRQNDDLTVCTAPASVAAMARRWNTTPEAVLKVLLESGLFTAVKEAQEQVSSPYLDRVSEALWVKRGDALRGKKQPKKNTPKRPADADLSTLPRASRAEQSVEKQEQSSEEESGREDANNSAVATPVVVAVVKSDDESPLLPVATQSWEALVDEMGTDRSWMDLVGMRSGLGLLYRDHQPLVLSAFKEHIRLYDKGSSLLRNNDTKAYFANYLSPGSRTCIAAREWLMQQIAKQQQQSQISPYETLIDLHRTYLGRLIPDEAPPRPDPYSVWDETAKRWRR